MNNKVVLRVQNSSTYIEGSLSVEIFTRLKYVLGYLPEDAAYMIKNSGKKGWDGRINLLCYKRCKCYTQKEKFSHFPTGLISKVREILADEEVEVKILDQRIKPVKTLDLKIDDLQSEKRDYQEEAVEKTTANGKGRGILIGATGCGKTRIAAGIIAKLGVAPFIFYVPSIDLLEQAQRELSRFIKHNSSNLDIGAIGGGQCSIKDVNVMTIQTAVRALGFDYKKFDDEEKDFEDSEDVKKKYSDIKTLIQNAKGIILDEAQHAASQTVQVISDFSTSAFYKIGQSATPYRDLNDDILIDACFGKKLYEISASYLIENGFLVQPTIYFVPVNNFKGVQGYTYHELYKTAIVENTKRNTWIANIAKKFHDQGRNILILVKQINHGKLLEKMIPGSKFIHGSTKNKIRAEHLQLVREGKERITIGSVIADEGIDCKPWDTLILAGSGKSRTRALQRVGRVLRPNTGKKDAVVIDFIDNCKWMLSHSKRREKIYRTEPKFLIEKLELE